MRIYYQTHRHWSIAISIDMVPARLIKIDIKSQRLFFRTDESEFPLNDELINRPSKNDCNLVLQLYINLAGTLALALTRPEKGV